MRTFIILLLLTSVLRADVDWFGYYEGEIDGGSVPDQNIIYGYNKLRLDLDSSPSDDVRIRADVIYKQFYGQTELNFLDFIDPSFRPPGLNYLPYQLRDTLYIDNMFLEFHHNLFDLTLGKQQVAPGVGYAWNPTDVFNFKDIMDPTYENTGVSAIRLSIPIGLRTTLSGILQPENSWNESVQYYQLKAGIGLVDMSILYSRSLLRQSMLIKTRSKPHDLYGFNLEGELAGIGLRTEIAAHRLDYDTDNLQYEFIVGADYTFENSLYLLTEYYHNDLAAEAEQSSLDDYLIYFSGVRKSLNQNYLFGLAMYPLGDLLDLSAFGILNIDDKSLVLAPQILYRIYQDVELSLMGSLFLGADDSEFGYQQLGLRFRVRAYF